MNGGGAGAGGAAPTGCYKCGRPGHWSRDCPSSTNPNPNSTSNDPNTISSSFNSGGGFGPSKPVQKSSEKPKKVPRTRPKLTPELLLSDDGLGYVLRHFPRAFKYRGRGHEFVHKVEQVGAAKRVRSCVGGLRERVANGGDPTKLHEPPGEHENSNHDQEAMNLGEQDASLENHDTGVLQEEMLQEIYKQATEEPSTTLHGDTVAAEFSDHSSVKELPNQAPNNTAASSSGEINISEEQRARMEANKIKALERAAARTCTLQAT